MFHYLRMFHSIYPCCLLANVLLVQGHFPLCKCPSVRLQNWWKCSNLAFWTLVGDASIVQLSVSCWGSLTLLAKPPGGFTLLSSSVLLQTFLCWKKFTTSRACCSPHWCCAFVSLFPWIPVFIFIPFFTLIARSLTWESLCCICLTQRGQDHPSLVVTQLCSNQTMEQLSVLFLGLSRI